MSKVLDSVDAVAGLIDHALLHPMLTSSEVRADVGALGRFPLASVCVRPSDVPAMAPVVAEGAIGAVCTVIGFPHGTTSTGAKVAESERAVRDGCRELDMVCNIARVLGEEWSGVRDDIAAVIEVGRAGGALVKVIFETDYVTSDAHKVRLCEICTECGADFVKTSTGFGFVKGADGRLASAGATDHDIALMRQHAGPRVGVKASGGVRTLDDVVRLHGLGATRIGASATRAILAEAAERFGDAPGIESPPSPTAQDATGY
ncbi:MAG: deoxyribose-phosphate aldolase [Planctomycetota bacterium]